MAPDPSPAPHLRPRSSAPPPPLPPILLGPLPELQRRLVPVHNQRHLPHDSRQALVFPSGVRALGGAPGRGRGELLHRVELYTEVQRGPVAAEQPAVRDDDERLRQHLCAAPTTPTLCSHISF